MDSGPFILDFKDYHYFDKPIFVYKKFVIYIESEDSIIVGFQPFIKESDKELIIKSLKMIVTNVKTREL